MKSPNFSQAILFVLRNEGGYSDDKNDKGGATNYGISTRFLKLAGEDINGDGHIDKEDAKIIGKEKAIELYKTHFWDHYKLDLIRDTLLARKIFDIFVNMRGSSASKIIQRACNSFGLKLAVDGVLGVKSFNAINTLGNNSNSHCALIDAIKKEQSAFYQLIVKKDKSQKKFLIGWLNRANRA